MRDATYLCADVAVRVPHRVLANEEELPLVEILPERSEEVAQRVLVVSKEAAAQGRIVQVQDVLPGRAGECHVVRLVAPTVPRLRHTCRGSHRLPEREAGLSLVLEGVALHRGRAQECDLTHPLSRLQLIFTGAGRGCAGLDSLEFWRVVTSHGLGREREAREVEKRHRHVKACAPHRTAGRRRHAHLAPPTGVVPIPAPLLAVSLHSHSGRRCLGLFLLSLPCGFLETRPFLLSPFVERIEGCVAFHVLADRCDQLGRQPLEVRRR